jgi:uncharacterized protein YbjQ (UPF0145 family)
MLVVTTEQVPGYDIVDVLGEVMGVTARTRNPYAEGVKALSGEVNPSVSRALTGWREEAIANMITTAHRRGANAVIGMRFDHRDISSSWAEICAYGTAVRVVRALDHDHDHDHGRDGAMAGARASGFRR